MSSQFDYTKTPLATNCMCVVHSYTFESALKNPWNIIKTHYFLNNEENIVIEKEAEHGISIVISRLKIIGQGKSSVLNWVLSVCTMSTCKK